MSQICFWVWGQERWRKAMTRVNFFLRLWRSGVAQICLPAAPWSTGISTPCLSQAALLFLALVRMKLVYWIKCPAEMWGQVVVLYLLRDAAKQQQKKPPTWQLTSAATIELEIPPWWDRIGAFCPVTASSWLASLFPFSLHKGASISPQNIAMQIFYSSMRVWGMQWDNGLQKIKNWNKILQKRNFLKSLLLSNIVISECSICSGNLSVTVSKSKVWSMCQRSSSPGNACGTAHPSHYSSLKIILIIAYSDVILSAQTQSLSGSTTPNNLNSVFLHAVNQGQTHPILFSYWTVFFLLILQCIADKPMA